MTARLSPQPHYVEAVTLWRDAGAGVLDGIEALLTALAFTKTHPATTELTQDAWLAFSRDLWRDLAAEQYPLELDRAAQRVPGLLEQTRRIADAAVPAPADIQAFVAGLITFFAHGPQTGLRRAMPGLGAQPSFLAPLVKALLGPGRSRKIYVPFESSGWLPVLLAAAGWHVAAELQSVQLVRTFKLLARLGEWPIEVRLGDPMRSPSWIEQHQLRTFECTAAVVAFGARGHDERQPDAYGRFPFRFLLGESAQLAHLLAQSCGVSLAVMPENFLFRAAGAERDYKEQLVRSGTLSAVIRLPRTSFAPETNIQTSMLVLDAARHKPRDVVFVDGAALLRHKQADSEHDNAIAAIANAVKTHRGASVATATIQEIASNAFNLTVERYVRNDAVKRVEHVLEKAETVELNDLAELIRPQAYPVTDDGQQTVRFAEVGLADLRPDGAIAVPTKLIEIAERQVGKVIRYRLQQGDILLSVRGRIGAVGMVGQWTDDSYAGYLASQAFVILRLRETSPVQQLTLYRYLASPMGQGLLRALAGGTTVPMVNMGDIKRLKIMIPSEDEEREIARQHEKVRQLRTQIANLEKLTTELDAAAWPMTKTISNAT